MKPKNHTVLFGPMEEGGYLAVAPALPGVVSYGATLAEARAMGADAIRCHCEGLLKDGEPLPPDTQNLTSPVQTSSLSS
jgi:predicted RNase H-like HicB family nuclease